MNESDKTFGTCPVCGGSGEYMTGRWQEDNPTLSNGKKACVSCKVGDIYAEFFNRNRKSLS